MRIVQGFEAGKRLLERRPGELDPTVVAQARRIVEDVRKRGDAAVRDHTRRLDGLDVGDLEVPRQQFAEALRQVPAGLVDALRTAGTRPAGPGGLRGPVTRNTSSGW